MAILCSHCGQQLPRDDARFCNNCGTTVPLSAHTPQAIDVSALPPETSLSRSGLREQIAQQPPARAVQRKQDEAPEWLEQLGQSMPPTKGAQRRKPDRILPGIGMHAARQPVKTTEISWPDPQFPNASIHREPPGVVMPEHEVQGTRNVQEVPLVDQGVWEPQEKAFAPPERSPMKMKNNPVQHAPVVDWLEPLPPIAVNESVLPTDEEIQARQEDFPTVPLPSSPVEHPRGPVRELRIKVWDQDAELPVEQVAQQFIAPESAAELEPPIEHLPTQPMLEAMPSSSVVAATVDEVSRSTHTDVEQLDTVPFLPNMPKVAPVAATPRPEYHIVRENTPLPAAFAAQVLPDTPRPAQFSPATAAGVPAHQEFVPVALPVAPGVGSVGKAERPKGPRPLVLALLALMVLVIGSVAWVIIAQPFNVPVSTEPLVTYSNATAGFSLMYPNDWNITVDKGRAQVQFYDSNHTDQFNVTATKASGADLAAYLQQQASGLGIKNGKGGTAVVFGGATWQQIQGNMLQSGENYTVRLLVTRHSGHLYVLTQLAPQVTFADEESAVFSEMRRSWQFVA